MNPDDVSRAALEAEEQELQQFAAGGDPLPAEQIEQLTLAALRDENRQRRRALRLALVLVLLGFVALCVLAYVCALD